MNDLDARVAALLDDADTYAATQRMEDRYELEQDLRAELQKPAQEELVTAKTKRLMAEAKSGNLTQEPAQEEITDKQIELITDLRDALACCRNWSDPEDDNDSTPFPTMQVSRAIEAADAAIRASKGEKT